MNTHVKITASAFALLLAGCTGTLPEKTSDAPDQTTTITIAKFRAYDHNEYFINKHLAIENLIVASIDNENLYKMKGYHAFELDDEFGGQCIAYVPFSQYELFMAAYNKHTKISIACTGVQRESTEYPVGSLCVTMSFPAH